MAKNTGKVREFCQSRKVGTLSKVKSIQHPQYGPVRVVKLPRSVYLLRTAGRQVPIFSYFSQHNPIFPIF